MFESRRHHADDLDCLSVELNLLSDDVWVTAKTARPKTIGEHDNVIGAGLKLFGLEDTTVRGRDAQHRKEIGSRGKAEQTFRVVAIFREVAAREGVGRELVKDCVLVVLVEEVCD